MLKTASLFLFPVIIFFSCHLPAEKKPNSRFIEKTIQKQPQAEKEISFYINAHLSQQVSNKPCCGTFECFENYPFKNDSIEDTLHIIFSCPEFLGADFFKKGNNYRILVTKTLPSGYIEDIEHPNVAPPKNWYFEKKIEKLK